MGSARNIYLFIFLWCCDIPFKLIRIVFSISLIFFFFFIGCSVFFFQKKEKKRKKTCVPYCHCNSRSRLFSFGVLGYSVGEVGVVHFLCTWSFWLIKFYLTDKKRKRKKKRSCFNSMFLMREG